jgi:hypothetical protein
LVPVPNCWFRNVQSHWQRWRKLKARDKTNRQNGRSLTHAQTQPVSSLPLLISQSSFLYDWKNIYDFIQRQYKYNGTRKAYDTEMNIDKLKITAYRGLLGKLYL